MRTIIKHWLIAAGIFLAVSVVLEILMPGFVTPFIDLVDIGFYYMVLVGAFVLSGGRAEKA